MKYVILGTTLKLYLVYKQILDGKTGSETGSVLAKITQLHTGAKKTHHLIADHVFSVCLMTNLPPHLLSDAGFFQHLDSETRLAGSRDEEHHCLPVCTHTHTHTHTHTPLPPCPCTHTRAHTHPRVHTHTRTHSSVSLPILTHSHTHTPLPPCPHTHRVYYLQAFPLFHLTPFSYYSLIFLHHLLCTSCHLLHIAKVPKILHDADALIMFAVQWFVNQHQSLGNWLIIGKGPGVFVASFSATNHFCFGKFYIILITE